MRFRRGLVGWVLFLLLGPGGFAGGVSLEEVAAQKWLKTSTGELTIITDASEDKLREWAAEMAWFRSGLHTALPLGQGGVAQPATIFLFKSDRTMRRYLPEAGSKPILVSGYFSSVLGHHVGMIGLDGSRFDVREKLFHEMTHWYLAGADVDIPLWLHEGLAQIFESSTLQGASFRVGHNRPELLLAVKIAGTPALEPLLTQADVDLSRAAWKHGMTALFYAQAWSLSHMLFFGADGGSRLRFAAYLQALRSGLEGTRAFEQGFGLSLPGARQQLDVYVRVPKWKFETLLLDRTVTRDSFKVEPLGPADLYREFGRLQLAAGHPETAAQFISYACSTAGTDARNWELAGALALWKQPAEPFAASEAFEKARARSSGNPWIYLELGYGALSAPDLADKPEPGSPAADRLREAGNLFRQAGRLRPNFKPAVEAMAGIILVSPDPPEDFRAMVRAGMTCAQGSPIVQLAVADGEVKDGQFPVAQGRLERLLRAHPDMSAELAAKARQLLLAAEAAPRR